MLRLLLKPLIGLLVAFCCLAGQSHAQNPNTAAREAEWRNHKLPASDFVRHVDPSNAVMFRVPAGWTREGSGLKFKSPDSAELHVFVEKVPDGVPLKSLVAGALQSLREVQGGIDALIVRRTQMASVEAREIVLELPNEEGVMTRRIIWYAVVGTHAVTFVFIAPVAQIDKTEPYFKAAVQSAVIFDSQFNYTSFEKRRAGAIKDGKPARIDEAQSLTATLDGIDPAARAKAVERLAAIFSSSPDSVIDLVINKMPVVRAAAVDAISMSGNKALVKFLVHAAGDRDAYVAERAGKALAKLPEAVELLREETSNWSDLSCQALLNATPFLEQKARLQIIAELLKASPGATPTAITPPPPAAATGGIPGGVSGGSKEFIAICMLRGIPASDFKMPLDTIIAAKDQSVIAAALRTVLERRESVPVDSLLKLVSSPNDGVRFLAALNLGQSATAADIARIEAIIRQIPGQSAVEASDQKPSARRDEAAGLSRMIADELRVTIKKIRFREQLGPADKSARSKLMKDAMLDSQLTGWIYSYYLRDEIEGPRPKIGSAINETPPQDRVISLLGENLFPSNVTHYVALPNPGVALNNPGDSLTGLQMDSAQGQANLALMLSYAREQFRSLFGTPPGEAMLDYLGINMNAPVAMASWSAEGAPRGLWEAQREALLLRVSDRDRFESLVATYQAKIGNFIYLPGYASTGARLMGLAPALLPIAVMAAMEDDPKPKKRAPSTYLLVNHTECNGYPVKVFERLEVDQDGGFKSDRIYLAYVGDAAVLAPFWNSLRDCLSRLASGRPSLGSNAEFKRVAASRGDVIYLSDIGAVLDTLSGKGSSTAGGFNLTESGTLNVSRNAWENSFRFSFKESGWDKPLLPFHPSEASAPRDLLPRSTVIYLLMKFEADQAWREWAGSLFTEDDIEQFKGLWAMDFEKEVLPDLGPECGAALLGLPKLAEPWDAPWIVYFKLKSDKLTAAMRDGRLLKGIQGGARSVPIKLGSTVMFLGFKNGYLILSGTEAGIERLDLKEKLDGARDFVRAAKPAPAGVIAFGGYNLEAVIEGMGDYTNDPTKQRSITNFASIARAFHSQNFYAKAASGQLDARMSVSLDREGRYSVERLSMLSHDYRPTNAIIEARGVAIADQKQLKSLKLKIRAKGQGIIDRIKTDIGSTHQEVEKRSDDELVVTVAARKPSSTRSIQLPVSDAQFAPFLKPTRELRSDDETVKAKAREIAGDDRDAWSVASKLANWTYKNLQWKRVDDADAAETLSTREADCLEFSQLFVALARSLGLPARIVSGLAYGSGSFGAHAWVEVYVGEWVEIDPTWGTDFADATHVRSASDALLSYAALNVVEIEVVEATRHVADFQRNATSLVEKLCEELPQKNSSALAAALDIAALADEFIGAGAWNSMSAREREQISSAHRRLIEDLSTSYGPDQGYINGMRLLGITQTENTAEALVSTHGLLDDLLLKIKLARRGDAWSISEWITLDYDLHVVAESLQPTVRAILDQRQGKAADWSFQSEYSRAVIFLDEDEAHAALELAEKALRADPASQRFRYLKALSLAQLDKTDEGVKALQELSDDKTPYAPAVYMLALYHQASESEGYKKAAELFERYAALVPGDPRPHSSLAGIYAQRKEGARAEAEYNALIKCDPRSTKAYLDFAEYLASLDRHGEALAKIDEGAKHGKTSDEMFSDLIERFHLSPEKRGMAERLAATQPERMEKNAMANTYLASMRIDAGLARNALPLLNKAIGIDPDHLEAHLLTALAYRKLQNWQAALAAADAALKLDDEDSDAHYHRACALARLGRKAEAISALKQAIEFDEDLAEEIGGEPDLKPLAVLLQFRELIKSGQNGNK